VKEDAAGAWTYDRVVCSVCGKVVKGRLPRDGRLVGDGSAVMPRRHKQGPGPIASPEPGAPANGLRDDGTCWGYHEAAKDYEPPMIASRR
jgi:hypothetical protein